MNSNDIFGSIFVIAIAITICFALVFGSKCSRDESAIKAGYSQSVDPNTNKIIWVAPENSKIEK